MNNLLKRIQRDRDEQLAHRKKDSQTLIQRNRNVLLDLIERHRMENKRTGEFLKFALGNRSKDPGRAVRASHNKSIDVQESNNSSLPHIKESPNKKISLTTAK